MYWLSSSYVVYRMCEAKGTVEYFSSLKGCFLFSGCTVVDILSTHRQAGDILALIEMLNEVLDYDDETLNPVSFIVGL
jgi:hypothetical protein